MIIKIKRQKMIYFSGNGSNDNQRQFYYVICGNNGEPTSTSEMFTRKASAKRAADRLLDNGLMARIIDESKE